MPHPQPATPRVQRYDGRPLGPSPHIAVLGSCKVGNFVVSLPLLRALRRRHPTARIDFWGSDATADFEQALVREGLLNWRISWDQGSPEAFGQLAAAGVVRGAPDLVVNCDGFNPLTQVLASWLRPTWVAGGALTANGRRELPWGEHPYQRFLADRDWDAPAFVERYGGLFQSNYIAELLCRLAFVEPTSEELEQIALPWVEPPFAVPPLLIHCTTTRAAKIWPFERWAEVLQWCAQRGLPVGLVGAPPARQAAEYHAGCGEEQLLAEFGIATDGPLIDLRGRTSLIELAGACRAARAVVSVDAGPLHIAAAVGTPVLAVVGNDAAGVGASPIRLWLPRAPQLGRTISTTSCSGCVAERFRNDGCVAERHHCMEGVDPAQVIHWLEQEVPRSVCAPGTEPP
uniref:glycosyltransferase family 9 protein n=1 Tax=Cyanobium sp. TaxID=2164130 RepID=UPI0040471B9C